MANRIEIIIDSVTTGLESGLKKTEHGLGRFKFAALGAGIAVGGALAVGLEKSVEASIEAQKTQARLDQAFRAVGISARRLEPSIEAVEKKARTLGFTNDDVRIGLGSLVTATGNYHESVRELAIAEDLARYKGVSLGDATKALTMLHAGSTRALKQLGLQVVRVTSAEDKVHEAFKKHTGAAYLAAIATAKLTDKQLTAEKTLKMTADRVHGQGEAFAKTAAGGMAQFHAQLENIEVQIGNKLLPVLTRTLQYIVTNWPAMAAKIQETWTTQIKPPLDAMIALVKTVVETIRAHWSTIGPIVRQVATILETNIKIITNSLRLVTALLHGDWSAAWVAAKAIVMAEVNAIKAIVSLAAQAIVALARGIGAGIKAGIREGIAGVSALVTDALGAIQHAIRVVAGAALGWATEIGARIVSGVLAGLTGLAGAVGHAIHEGISAGIHAAGKVLHGSGEFMFTKEAVGKPLMDGIVAGIMANPIGDALTGSLGASAPRAGLALAGAGGGGGQIVFNFPNYIGSRTELKQAMREAARSFSDLNGRGIAG